MTTSILIPVADSIKKQLFLHEATEHPSDAIYKILQMPVKEILSYALPDQISVLSGNSQLTLDSHIEYALKKQLNSFFKDYNIPLELAVHKVYSKNPEENGKSVYLLGSNNPYSYEIAITFDIDNASEKFTQIHNFRIDKDLPVSSLVDTQQTLSNSLQEIFCKQMAQFGEGITSVSKFQAKLKATKKEIDILNKRLAVLQKYEETPLIYTGDSININPNGRIGSPPQLRRVDAIQCTPSAITIHFESEGDEFPFIDLAETWKYEVIPGKRLTQAQVISR